MRSGICAKRWRSPRRAASSGTNRFARGKLALFTWEFDRDATKVLDYLEQAITIARAANLPSLETSWLNNSGTAFRDTGRLDEALGRFERALARERETGQRRRLPMLCKNIGQVLSPEGKADAAEHYLVDARDEADRHNPAKFRWESRMHLSAMAETVAQHLGSTQHGAVSFEDRFGPIPRAEVERLSRHSEKTSIGY